MSRKSKHRVNTNEKRHHHHERHHHTKDVWAGEVDSTGEEVIELESSGALAGDVSKVPSHISTTGRLLSDYPVQTAFETPAEREERRQETADKQVDNIDDSQAAHEEDVQIDRYRANHHSATTYGKPHTMIDDELTHSAEDHNTVKTASGGVVVNKLAHEKSGLRQSLVARHAAFKRLIGLGDNDVTISPVSGNQKK
jgi:hypothetical protein